MEIYWSSEYIKILTDEIVDWDTNTTYVWYASFDWNKIYSSEEDKAKPIWKIRKVVSEWANTETFYANWNEWFINVWNDRTSLIYI